jgi:hypothetical protein
VDAYPAAARPDLREKRLGEVVTPPRILAMVADPTTLKRSTSTTNDGS